MIARSPGPESGADADDHFMPDLMREHGGALFGYATRLCGDRHLAEDVVQEALLRAWQHRFVLDEQRGSIRGWLLTVVRNILIDRSRASQVRPSEVAEPSENLTPVGDPSDRVITSVVVTQALVRLSDEHRRVLVQLYFWDRSVAEAAAVLGVPAGTVKSRSHYALAQLRAMMRPVTG